MPPTLRSTRRRVASQSQSQPKSQEPLHRLLPSALERETIQSFTSTSTASLPPRHVIHLAVAADQPSPRGPAAAEIFVRGQELLVDGWRRPGDKEGRLDALRRNGNRRRQVSTGLDGAIEDPLDLIRQPADLPKILWYTAGYAHPCICQLNPASHAWSPRASPPRNVTLPGLTTIASHLVPPVGPHMPDWSSRPLAPVEDLDALLDDFLHGWQSADGAGWGSAISTSQFDDGCEDLDEVGNDSVDTTVDVAVEASQDRKKRKGKERKVFLPPRGLVPPTSSDHAPSAGEEPSGGLFARSSSRTEVDEDDNVLDSAEPSAETWDEEVKRRKQWWRDYLRSDPSDGQMWEIIPRPHALQPRVVNRKRKKDTAAVPPDYVLPRFYAKPSSTHPYHPDFPAYLDASPSTRVYWLIPISGPVHVARFADHLTKQSLSSTPAPSCASLSINADIDSGRKVKPRPLAWSPALLRHFWTDFLVPLHDDPSLPFGSFSVRLSGPKPDPYLALKASPPLPAWSLGGVRAERPESGDHIRVYVNAKRALAFRTWLHAVEVDLYHLEQKGDLAAQPPSGTTAGISTSSKSYRPFEKVRLALIGERGEVLLVA